MTGKAMNAMQMPYKTEGQSGQQTQRSRGMGLLGIWGMGPAIAAIALIFLAWQGGWWVGLTIGVGWLVNILLGIGFIHWVTKRGDTDDNQ